MLYKIFKLIIVFMLFFSCCVSYSQDECYIKQYMSIYLDDSDSLHLENQIKTIEIILQKPKMLIDVLESSGYYLMSRGIYNISKEELINKWSSFKDISNYNIRDITYYTIDLTVVEHYEYLVRKIIYYNEKINNYIIFEFGRINNIWFFLDIYSIKDN